MWIYFGKIRGSCDLTDRGLVSLAAVSNEQGDCTWKKAGVCWLYVTDGLFDAAFWGKDTCESQTDDLSYYNKMYVTFWHK